jgi:hypothetical protein
MKTMYLNEEEFYPWYTLLPTKKYFYFNPIKLTEAELDEYNNALKIVLEYQTRFRDADGREL